MVLSAFLIPSRIEVTHSRVTLYDLVDDPSASEEVLKSIVVAYLPEGTHTLYSSYVKSLAKRKGIDLTFESSMITVRVIKKEEKVSIKTFPQNVLNLASEIALYVSTDTGLCTKPSTWNLLWYNGDYNGESYDITYTKLGNNVFSVFLRLHSNPLKFLTLRLSVSCYREVLVLNRNLRHGETIYPDYVEFVERDVFMINGTPAGTEEVYYAKARNFLKKGEVLTLEKIKRRPDVVKGQLLIAYVKLPGIYITTMVEALEDGWIGDTIRVKNISSGKIIEGVVEEGPVLKVLEVER